MRISDWSSDVCSSDLCGAARRERAGRAGDAAGGGAAAHLRRGIDRGRAGRGQAARGGQPAAAGGDRKSVVEGKSVSVRVDLGGRRIIKKKNITYIQRLHDSSILHDIQFKKTI